jgi:hypothetical protein
MPFETFIDIGKNLVNVKLSGFISKDELRKEALRLREYAYTFGKMKYLIDIREAITMPTTWSVLIAKPDNWYLIAKLCKEVAIVIKEEDSVNMQNIDMIARYTGAKVKLFHDTEVVYKWLGVQRCNPKISSEG